MSHQEAGDKHSNIVCRSLICFVCLYFFLNLFCFYFNEFRVLVFRWSGVPGFSTWYHFHIFDMLFSFLASVLYHHCFRWLTRSLTLSCKEPIFEEIKNFSANNQILCSTEVLHAIKKGQLPHPRHWLTGHNYQNPPPSGDKGCFTPQIPLVNQTPPLGLNIDRCIIICGF